MKVDILRFPPMEGKQQITWGSHQTQLHKNRVKTVVGPSLKTRPLYPLGWFSQLFFCLVGSSPSSSKGESCLERRTSAQPMKDHYLTTVIQNAVSVAIAVSVVIGKNRLNAEITFHIALKTRFGQLKNLSIVAVSSRIGHILNHCNGGSPVHRSAGLCNWESGAPQGTASLSGPFPQTSIFYHTHFHPFRKWVKIFGKHEMWRPTTCLTLIFGNKRLRVGWLWLNKHLTLLFLFFF